MPAPMDDHWTAQARRFRIQRPERLGAQVKMHTRRGKKDPAHAKLCISPPQLFQRRFDIMHRQNANALEAGIPPQVSLGEPVVVGPSGAHGIIAVYDTADALPRGGKKDRILEPDLIDELNPPFGSGILEPTVRTNAKSAGRSSRQRELDMALAGEHTSPHARRLDRVGKVPGDGFSILKNVAVTINDFRLLSHRILLYRDRSCVDLCECCSGYSFIRTSQRSQRLRIRPRRHYPSSNSELWMSPPQTSTGLPGG